MARIFISYRRDDTAGHAGWLNHLLSQHFGQHEIFRDIDTIEPGVDFVEAIHREVSSCSLLIAMIGRQWLTVTDKSGRRRLDNPTDYVRLEIATALKRNIRVIPILVHDASMPSSDELPDDLALLARRNAVELHEGSFAADVERLIPIIEKVLRDVVQPPPSQPFQHSIPDPSLLQVQPLQPTDKHEQAPDSVSRPAKRRPAKKVAPNVSPANEEETSLPRLQFVRGDTEEDSLPRLQLTKPVAQQVPQPRPEKFTSGRPVNHAAFIGELVAGIIGVVILAAMFLLHFTGGVSILALIVVSLVVGFVIAIQRSP